MIDASNAFFFWGPIRSTEKDKIKIIESFRLGDVVRALVVGLAIYFFEF